MTQNIESDEAGEGTPLGSEAEVARALDVSDLETLTPQNLVRLAALLPQIEPGVARDILAQYPQHYEALKSTYGSTLSANEKSEDQVYGLLERSMSMYERELERVEPGTDEWKLLVEKHEKAAERGIEVDSTNKKFLDSQFGQVVKGVTAAVAVSAFFVAGALLSGRGGNGPSVGGGQA